MALATRPRPLLLDEPTAGMSGADSHAMVALIREIGREVTLLFTEHDMRVVFSIAERITVFQQGKVIADGEPDAISRDPLTPRRGRVVLESTDITGWRPDRVARAGIGWVPEDRRIFPRLTVGENVRIAAETVRRPGPWTEARIWDLFPTLRDLRHHLGTQLSGGEQQMLAIARTLAMNPKLILLDEPCEGLAPVIVAALAVGIRAIRDGGTTVLLVEQNARFARRVVDRAYVLDNGQVQLVVAADVLRQDEALQLEHLGVIAGR